MKLQYLFITCMLAVICITAPRVHAQGNVNTGNPPPPSYPTLKNPIKVNSIQELLVKTVDIAIFIGTIIATLMFIYTGFKFVMAQGSDKGIEEAKKLFLSVVIGTAVLISSKVIIEVVKNTFISAGLVDKQLFENK